ncbi:uncharacterized protein [Agelaius tricolor]|uniref:uncharacterized protein isoform X2 n=1 Tax=Agelaius tricolor TaxID=9191 RepID=UPI0039F24834
MSRAWVPPGPAFLVQEQSGAGAEAPAISSAAAVARDVPGPGADSSPSARGPRELQGWNERGPRPARRPRPRPAPTIGCRGCRGTASAATAAVTALPPQGPQSALRAGCSQPGLGQQLHSAIRRGTCAQRLSLPARRPEFRLKMPQLVKVCMESCPYFQLACPRDVYHMVPAGASARAHPLQPRREQGLLPQAGLHHCKGKEFGPLVPELCWTSLPSWTSPSVQSSSF